jgi:DNA-binding response OmpR family regulator
MKVLVVEDEAVVAFAECRTISALGYSPCGIASNGEEAISVFRRELPAIVCLDIGLPGSLDGIDVAARILAEASPAILFITGYDDEERLGRAKLLKPVCLLQKPISRALLKSGLEAASRASRPC